MFRQFKYKIWLKRINKIILLSNVAMIDKNFTYLKELKKDLKKEYWYENPDHHQLVKAWHVVDGYLIDLKNYYGLSIYLTKTKFPFSY